MRRGLAYGSVLLATLASPRVHAEPARGESATAERARAKDAYDRGVHAHERGDYARAAADFAEADAIAPSDVALSAALDAATDADDPALGSELLERARRAEPLERGSRLAESVAAAKKKLEGRAGRVAVVCPSGATCRATVDGRAIDTKAAAWSRVGTHTVIVTIDGEAQSKVVEVRAGQTENVSVVRGGNGTSLAAAATPETPVKPVAPVAGRERHGLPPWVFWTSVAVTGVAAVTTTAFMLSAQSAHSDFVSAGCARAPEAPCATLKSDGEGASTRANVMLGVTAAFAVATVVIGAAFTDFGGGRRTGSIVPAVVPLASGGAFAGAHVRF